MSSSEVLVTLPSSLRETVHQPILHRLSGSGCILKALYRDEPLGELALCEVIAESAGYVVALERVSSKVIEAAQNLKVISKFGIGTDNIDVAAAEQAGVAVANCPGSNSNAVAELSVCLMISLSRDVQNQCNDLRAGHWNCGVGLELARKSVGIVGFGNIGRAIARYLAPFNTRVRAYDISPDPSAETTYGIEYTTLDELLAKSDIVSVHLPLTPTTDHLLNSKMLSRIKRGAFLINLARGGVVDEDALWRAVEEGQICRAAVDVFECEPPTGSRLLDDNRFIVLPHVGGVTAEAIMNMTKMAIDNILEVLAGRALSHPIRSH